MNDRKKYSEEDIYFYTNHSSKNKNSTIILKWLILIIVLIIFLVLGIKVYSSKKEYYNSYKYIEDKLVKEAKKYVNDNNLKSSKEFYLEAKKINVDLGNNCYNISGVFVNGDNYLPYLICSDYETKIKNNNNNQYIKLNGRDIVFVHKKDKYTESYYESLKDVDVFIESNVANQEGVYEVNYIVSKNDSMISKLTRKVVVLDNKQINDFYPDVSLIGNEIEYVEVNSEYIEKGISAYDEIDGVINKFKFNGNVNTNEIGEYKIDYIVINSRNYAKSVSRKINVVSDKAEIQADYLISPEDFTDSNVKISLVAYGEYFDYILVPNGEKIYDTSLQYEVSENGKYIFKLYNKFGKFKEEIIEIKNIDKESPVGTCTGYYIDNKSYVTVNASDNSGIIDKYLVGGNEFKNNVITLNGELKNVTVLVYDKVGNHNTVSCELEDKNPVTSACNDKTIYPGNKYTFTQAQKEKMAAMVYTEADGSNDYLGMKLVASHMCNYYEKLYKNQEWTGKQLHWLITNSSWYADMTKNSKYNPNLHQLALKAVEEVMVQGNRILPHYIDEFDMFPNDVQRPLKNVEEYVKDETIYYGYSWIKVTFWCINLPDGKKGNIFGYTEKPTN